LLAPDLHDRFATASAVLADLSLFEAGHPPQALLDGFPRQLDEAPTRRTRPPLDTASEATRRTDRSAAPDAQATSPAVVSPQPAAPAAVRPATVPPVARPVKPPRSRLRTVLLLAALLLVCNELAVGFQAGRVAARVMTRELDGMEEIWGQYRVLSDRSYLRMGIVGLEQTLGMRVRRLSELVIANYRSTQPTVRERQWRMAQENLQQALILNPGSDELKASLRYCEGHLHRIDGEAEKLRRRTASANQHFTEAVTAFREAAELRRGWPDPFLGLARTFIYGLEDIDRAADALKQAQEFGYTTGDRETAQLADGYRARGDALWQTSRGLADMPQESEYLQRATDAYKQAQGLYERIPGFAGVAANLRRTRRALEQIDQRSAQRAMEREVEDPGVTVPPADAQALGRTEPWR
jgi:hypothetical protein